MNQILIIGRIVKIEKRGNECDINLAVVRNYKNADGEYETDFIPCKTFGAIATNTFEYCKQGDLIGIKGRLESTQNKINVVAEKITFLSSKNYNGGNNENN